MLPVTTAHMLRSVHVQLSTEASLSSSTRCVTSALRLSCLCVEAAAARSRSWSLSERCSSTWMPAGDSLGRSEGGEVSSIVESIRVGECPRRA